ncbi:hypothetical protein ACFV7R_09065 [Streptomyces sp. NPDC059866]|uniref:hypothetical protein n=1 Tax=Streptomyces sp. NPDC059866 TaxID=3346978 RepID=UPI003660CAF7
MTRWTQDSYGHHEVNVVFARGTSLDALTGGLRELVRDPLDHGEGNGWIWAVHDMLNADIEDYDPVDYRRVCPDGAELVVTEPCSPKASRPTSTITATAG